MKVVLVIKTLGIPQKKDEGQQIRIQLDIIKLLNKYDMII